MIGIVGYTLASVGLLVIVLALVWMVFALVVNEWDTDTAVKGGAMMVIGLPALVPGVLIRAFLTPG